jgi:hypothetical protein
MRSSMIVATKLYFRYYYYYCCCWYYYYTQTPRIPRGRLAVAATAVGTKHRNIVINVCFFFLLLSYHSFSSVWPFVLVHKFFFVFFFFFFQIVLRISYDDRYARNWRAAGYMFSKRCCTGIIDRAPAPPYVQWNAAICALKRFGPDCRTPAGWPIRFRVVTATTTVNNVLHVCVLSPETEVIVKHCTAWTTRLYAQHIHVKRRLTNTSE